ncbi:MAG: hypothetical protein CGW95_03235 [Phenylobacterium zucineum]|nr:MAG: hypothetical protein CGW95_03235 [Phenylobacterium zucineum]
MQRTDGNYLYMLGCQLQPLHGINDGDTFGSVFSALIWAETSPDPFLHNSMYKLRHSLSSGENLLGWIRSIKDKLFASTDLSGDKIDPSDAHGLKYWLGTFEINLAAEFGQLPTYLVAKKGGYDTSDLIENGRVLFQPDLPAKVPEAIKDIEQATRCIAFEVPTAAGFHLHRANEAVLRRYFEAVAGDVPPPALATMGTYLATMRDKRLGDERVRSALSDLKDLHRNPLAHPGESLDSVEQAIDLLGAIRAAIGYMLKVIPVQVELALEGMGTNAADLLTPPQETVPET